MIGAKSIRCLLALLALLVALCDVSTAQETYVVERVVDGDTVVLDSGERVRLIGVDTPETVHPSKPVEHYGKEASSFTRKLLEGRTVRLEFDQQRRDKYDRILAYVFLDDLFVNAELIKQGYAHAYTQYPFDQEYMDLFRSLEREAREGERGLWGAEPKPEAVAADKGKYWLNTSSNTLHNSGCNWYGSTNQGRYTNEASGKRCGVCGGAGSYETVVPAENKQRPGETVYATKTGTKYHRGSCRHLRKSKIPMSLSQATARYSPCKTCRPPR